MTKSVREGVFFAAQAATLPRGRHQLSREEVLTSQRERLMAALTELLAAGGQANLAVGDVADRAHVSRASFYECFDDLEACAFAAYDRFIEVLLGRLIAAGGTTWDDKLYALVEAYLGTLQEDLVVARAFQVEMDALGPGARARRRRSLVRFAEHIRAERERLGSSAGPIAPLPLSAFVGAVYAARQLACDALDEVAEPDLLALAPELNGWLAVLLAPQPVHGADA